MRRSPAAAVLALLAITSACADPAVAPASPGAPMPSATPVNQSANPIDIAVIGDMPYGEAALLEMPSVVDALNADPKVRLAVHVGDIKSGSTLCSDAWFQAIAGQFARFQDPLVYAIGDNEWTDCHRANNGAYEPLDRLAKLREIFFATPGRALGGRNMGVEAQPGFPENQLWVASRVTFAVLHVLGSNNGLNPWFGAAETAEQGAAREAEVAARTAANIAWLEHAFAVAAEQRSVGIALFFQADLLDAPAPETGHQAFVARLAELAAGFAGPVLLVAGDSHDYRADAGAELFSFYGVTPATNVTNLIVDRTIEDDVEWLRLHVDPRSPAVFSWERVITP